MALHEYVWAALLPFVLISILGEAIEGVWEDLLRSLKARSDMHCDSLVGEEIGETADGEV